MGLNEQAALDQMRMEIEAEENNLENQEDFVENLAQALGLDGED